MACIIDNGYELGCATIAGVNKVYLGTYDAAVAYTFNTATDTVTDVTGSPTVYLFEQDAEYAGLEQSLPISRENGTVYYETVLSIKMIEMNAGLINSVRALSKAPLFAVIVANTGAYYILGVESAGRMTEGTSSLGVAMGDLNGANLSFTWKSQNGAYLLTPALLGTDITIG